MQLGLYSADKRLWEPIDENCYYQGGKLVRQTEGKEIRQNKEREINLGA